MTAPKLTSARKAHIADIERMLPHLRVKELEHVRLLLIATIARGHGPKLCGVAPGKGDARMHCDDRIRNQAHDIASCVHDLESLPGVMLDTLDRSASDDDPVLYMLRVLKRVLYDNEGSPANG